MRDSDRIDALMSAGQAEPLSVFPGSRRVGRWWPLVLFLLGVALFSVRALRLEDELAWLSPVSDVVALLSILGSFILLGLGVRDERVVRLVEPTQAQYRRLGFPFDVVRSTTGLMDLLLPEPTGEIPLPDRSVPYIARDIPNLGRAFAETGRVLLRGRSKTGKTRAVIELLRGYWRTLPTVLVLRRGAELQVPMLTPDDLPRRNLVVLIDDLHTHALACRERGTSVGAALAEVLQFFVRHCGDQPGDVRLVATARREPDCWGQIGHDPRRPPWSGIEVVDVPDLSTEEARQLAIELASLPPPLRLAPETADLIASVNDGTFYHMILAFRDWRRQPGRKGIDSGDAASLRADLASAWRHRRSVLLQHRPQLRYVYGALDALGTLGIPANRDLVSIVAQSLRGDLLTRFYGRVALREARLRRWLSARVRLRRLLLAVSRAAEATLSDPIWRMVLRTGRVLEWFFHLLPDTGDKAGQRRALWIPRLYLLAGLIVGLSAAGLCSVLGRMLVPDVVDLIVRAVAEWEVTARLAKLPAPWWVPMLLPLLPWLGWLGPGVALVSFGGVGKWLLMQLMVLDRRGLAQSARYVGTAEIPVVDSTLVPYELQVEGSVRELITQRWVSRLLEGEDLRGDGWSLCGLLRDWLGKADLGSVGGELSSRVGEILVRLDPQDAHARALVARSYAWQGEYEMAVAALRCAIDLDPNHVAACTGLGSAYRELARHEEAIRALDRAIELDPSSCRAYAHRGVVYAETGEYDKALADLSRAVDNTVGYVWAMAQRGKIHQEMGEYDRAVADLSRAIELEPNDGFLIADRGEVYRLVERYEEAQADYARAVGLEPDNARFHFCLGFVESQLGDLAGARAALERALAIDEAAYGPDHPEVARDVNNLGLVLQDLGDLAGARAAYERALGIGEAVYGPEHPTVVTMVNNLGSVLRDLGELAGAQAAIERALAIDEAVYGPDHPEVATGVSNLGVVLRELGDLAGARAAYERALAIDEAVYGADHPAVARDVNNLGTVLQALGDLAGARAAYERVLGIDEAVYGPDHPKVATDVNNLGLVLQELGDLAGARAAYERALAILEKTLPPDHPRIGVARRNVQTIKQAEDG